MVKVKELFLHIVNEVSNEIEGKQQQFHRKIIGYFKLDEKEQKLTLDV